MLHLSDLAQSLALISFVFPSSVLIMKISICAITIDRYEISTQCIGENIINCGVPREDIELLVADNGSTDKRIIEYVQSLKPGYHRLNSSNEGVSRAFNQLMNRAMGDYICLIGNDIKLPTGWLDAMVAYAEVVPNSGIIGIKCTAELPPLTVKKDHFAYNRAAHYLDAKYDKVFGTMLFSRKVLSTVGGFHEGFHPYGLEDSDFNNRVNLAGFQSLYLPEAAWWSNHIGSDVGNGTDYRKMKDESLSSNSVLFGERHAAYLNRSLPIYEPLPSLKDPI
jgi:GT2 family glycosyltransferase